MIVSFKNLLMLQLLLGYYYQHKTSTLIIILFIIYYLFSFIYVCAAMSAYWRQHYFILRHYLGYAVLHFLYYVWLDNAGTRLVRDIYLALIDGSGWMTHIHKGIAGILAIVGDFLQFIGCQWVAVLFTQSIEIIVLPFSCHIMTFWGPNLENELLLISSKCISEGLVKPKHVK